MKLLLTLLSLALFSYSLGISDIFADQRGGINEKIEELIPKDARKFYNELSSEDKEVLHEVIQNKENYATMDALLENLKSRSGVLYEKANSIIKEFSDSLDSLGPEAKAFVDELITRIRGLKMNIGISEAKSEFLQVVEKFKQLDDNAREEIKNAFPVISGVFQNPVFQSLMTMFLGINLDIPDAPTGAPATLYPSADEAETIEPPMVTVAPLTGR